MIKQSWVVNANGSEAMLYRFVDSGTKLEELGGVGNGLRRYQDQDLRTDRPGVMSAGGSHIHNKDALTTEVSPKQKAKEDFAQDILDELEAARVSDKLHSIDIIAEPSMLGLLKEKMNSNLSKLLDTTISKDASGKSTEQICDMLKKAN